MSDKENKTPITIKEEEIDVGKLFELIGNSFQKLFNFIFYLLKQTFHFLILILIFIKNHIIKVLVATLIGSFIGFGLDYISPEEYTYDMLIEPNYKSIDEIFEKVEYYNVLVESEDTISLAREFDISHSIAANLISFEINPYESEKDQILAYDNFIKLTDTLTHKLFSYEDFKGKGTSKFDSKQYVYRIKSYLPKLPSLEGEIVSSVEENSILKKRRRIQLNTINLDSIATRNAMKDLSSLRKLYEKIALLEVNKDEKTSSTYIDFSKESKANNDIELFRIAKSLNEDLIKIETKKETSDNIINVVSTFNPSGKKTSTFFNTKTFFLGWVFGGLVLLFILINILIKYLNNYSEKNTDY